jgi:hypothetical protein
MFVVSLISWLRLRERFRARGAEALRIAELPSWQASSKIS